ncbi:MAG TPA: sugar phosphate isomerase/epimerase [Opitutaceae bacterium]
MHPITRRGFIGGAAGAALAGTLGATTLGRAATAANTYKPRYVLSTSLYGTLPVAEIADQVAALGCDGLDVWAGRWGNQREQIDAMGQEAFAALLAQKRTRVCCYTCMDTGMNIKAEPPLRAMRKLGGDTVVAMLSSTGGDKDKRGDALRSAVRAQAEKLKPLIAVAGEAGAKLAIENHSGGVLATREAILWLMETIPEKHVGLALAPYHLPQEPETLGRLVADLGERLKFFYAWQHGDGSGEIPPPQQRRQLPGVGPLDFKPMLAALKRQRYAGWFSIFMHPTPRGAPVHPTLAETTRELQRAHAFIASELEKV